MAISQLLGIMATGSAADLATTARLEGQMQAFEEDDGFGTVRPETIEVDEPPDERHNSALELLASLAADDTTRPRPAAKALPTPMP